MKLKCLIIDDEPMALDVVKDYVQKVPFLKLCEAYRDSLYALDYLQKNEIDLIFLDINMPDLSGIQFLNSLVHQPMVIFTTAYSEFAVESYNFNAVDYLLKPIEFDRFLKAANKALEQHQQKNNLIPKVNQIQKNDSSIMIKSGTNIHNINTEDINYIESAGNYVVFYFKNKKIMSLLSLNKLLDDLPSTTFFRIHKSFIININFVSKIERHQVTIGDNIIPVGKIYREFFRQSVNK